MQTRHTHNFKISTLNNPYYISNLRPQDQRNKILLILEKKSFLNLSMEDKRIDETPFLYQKVLTNKTLFFRKKI